MPCVRRCRRSLASLKTHSTTCFLQPRVTPGPARTKRRLRLSFSLNDVNQQKASQPITAKTKGAKIARSPSQDTRKYRHLVGFHSHKSTPRRSAAPLSDPAYKTPTPRVSTTKIEKTPPFLQAPENQGDFLCMVASACGRKQLATGDPPAPQTR